MDIIPSYKCNFSCPFCINHKRDQSLLLDLDWLSQTLASILAKPAEIHLLGGELGLLDEKYLNQLIGIVSYYNTAEKPLLYTNLYEIPPLVESFNLTVSYDPGIRQHQDVVLQNMLTLGQPFSINMILTRNITDIGVKRLLKLAKHLKALTSINIATLAPAPGCPDIKPTPEAFVQFCKDIVALDTERKLRFYPLDTWRDGYTKQNNAIDSIEILPDKRFQISLRDHEGLMDFTTYGEAKSYYDKYHSIPNGECATCEFFLRCPHMYGGTDCIDKVIAKEISSIEYIPKL